LGTTLPEKKSHGIRFDLNPLLAVSRAHQGALPAPREMA
jgi:hypothetical protein